MHGCQAGADRRGSDAALSDGHALQTGSSCAATPRSSFGTGFARKTAWLLVHLKHAFLGHGRTRAMPLVGPGRPVDESLIACRSKDEPPSGGGRRSAKDQVAAETARRTCRASDWRPDKRPRTRRSAECGYAPSLGPPSARCSGGTRGSAGRQGGIHTVDPHVVGNMAAHMVLPWVHRRLRQPQDLGAGRLPRPPTPTGLQSYLDEFVFRFNSGSRTRQWEPSARSRTSASASQSSRLPIKMLIAPDSSRDKPLARKAVSLCIR